MAPPAPPSLWSDVVQGCNGRCGIVLVDRHQPGWMLSSTVSMLVFLSYLRWILCTARESALMVLSLVTSSVIALGHAILRYAYRARRSLSVVVVILAAWVFTTSFLLPPPPPPISTGRPGPSRCGLVGVFNGFLESGDRITIGPDSFCDVSVISPDKVDPSWPRQPATPVALDGFGGLAQLPVFLHHIPGTTNDLAHIMSHLGDQLTARAEYHKATETVAVAAPLVALPGTHSYHAEPLLQDIRSQYTVIDLPFSPSDVDKLDVAYMHDTTLVTTSVPLSDIYKYLTNHPTAKQIPASHVQTIKGWANTRFFAIIPPNSTKPILYTPSAAVKLHDCDAESVDLTRCLVPVIPRGADVRITTTPTVTAEATGDGTHYQDHDLRRDILLHVHDNAHHPSLDATQAAVRALCWFPHMKTFIDDHYNTCAYCVAATATTPAIGDAVHSKHRFRLVQVDHKILDAVVANATGCAAILTLVDSASRLTLFVPVETTSARDAAHAIFTRWYPFFSIPMYFVSDNGSAFASLLMRTVANLLGVVGWDFSAPDNPTHHSMAEARNKVMEHFLDVGASSGDITSFAALERYCAAATATCNLEYQYNGHSVFEYVTGSRPRTHADVVVKPIIDAVPLEELDAEFLASLRHVVAARLGALHHLRDDTARANALRRSAAYARTKTTVFDLRPGDDVSYNGERYTLLRHTRSTPTAPVRSQIRMAGQPDAAPTEVLYYTLRPLATQRPHHMLSRDGNSVTKVVEGAFVFYSHPSTQAVCGGVVTDVDRVGSRCMVHECREAEKRPRMFTKLYYDNDTDAYVTRVKPTPDMDPAIVTIALSDVIAVGTISATRFISESLVHELKSLGIVPEDAPAAAGPSMAAAHPHHGPMNSTVPILWRDE